MDGIRLIRLLDVLPVTSMTNALGVSPRSLIVKGENFHAVDTVLINGAASPSFVAYSTSELVAQVPEEYSDAVITEVMVLSASISYTAQSLLELTIGTKVRRVAGVQRLVQTFIRHLLRTPGSNIFHPTSGGGLARMVGKNIDDHMAADVAVAIGIVKQYIIGVQTPVRSIPPSERLLSAEIADLATDPARATVYVTIILTSHSGARSAATLVA